MFTYGAPIAPQLYQHALVTYMNQTPCSDGHAHQGKPTDIALVGMSARFPGATNVSQFWDNLCQGVESISFFSKEDISPHAQDASDPSYVAARGIVDGADCFDSKFFGMSPREADLIDPQQRVLLELAVDALADAGCNPETYDGSIGVWAGTYQNTYYTRNLLSHVELAQQVGELQMGFFNEKDYIATRISHKLNLRGPAVNVNTACSTSLVAVIEACDSLILGRCDLALAGGITLIFPQQRGHVHQEGSILTPDGHCRPFDQDAAGTLFSDGAGLVVLKRLQDAVRDNDQVYAVIKGTGINNDGAEKTSFTAPSVDGQERAIRMAHEMAGVDASTIGYVEAHGTGTLIGDPVELTALTQAFAGSSNRTQYCQLGSVKSNIGHTLAAAGVAGLIKAACALWQEKIPQTLHFLRPNPHFDFASSPFKVCEQLTDWPRSQEPRRAGVSSFGVGGTNAHVILEEPPFADSEHAKPDALPCQLLTLSAKSESALDRRIEALERHLHEHEGVRLDQAAFSSQMSQSEQAHRAYFAVRSRAEAIATLRNCPRTKSGKGINEGLDRPVVFMFPGQGAQYLGMGRDLYQHSAAFRLALDECDQHLAPLLEGGLLEALFAPKTDEAIARLQDTAFTQPAMFALSYASAQMWNSFDVQPVALLGHSIGEFVAAVVAGVMTLPDALRLIAERGRAMSALPPGSMLSVRAPAEDVQPLLDGDLVIASYNSPKLCVVAGPTDQIDGLEARLTKQQLAAKKLYTSHAFHSPMMESIVAPFEQLVSGIQLHAPQVPIYSTVTGNPMSDTEAVDPSYWANHLRLPVRFSQAVANSWGDLPHAVFVELGPRKTLAALAKQVVGKDCVLTPTLSDTSENNAEWQATMLAIGKLWAAGVEFNWNALHPEKPKKVWLPTYPFEQTRHFIDPYVPTQGIEERPLATPDPLEPNATQEHPTMPSRKAQIAAAINQIFQTTSGYDVSETDANATFFELGMDSLVLTQTAAAMKREFGVEVTFRQMLEETPTVESLCEFLDQRLPGEEFAAAAPSVTAAAEKTCISNCQSDISASASHVGSESAASLIIQSQLAVMQEQLRVLGGRGGEQTGATNSRLGALVPAESGNTSGRNDGRRGGHNKTFGAGARVSLSADELPVGMQRALDQFASDYAARMSRSKEYAQKHRRYLADPRTVSGFRPNLKEITFPVVAARSKGAYLWDLDGNKYIDVTSGFGSNLLGHSPDFMVEALRDQLNTGYEIGPQTPFAGEVAQLFCELTGTERVAFCNTGSEAVLGALRLARTFAGRDKFVMFQGDYHGINDEVIARSNKQLQTFPAATGIPSSNVQNAVILEYGTDESLEYIAEHIDQLAAVLVESVQSRRPEFQPKEFLQKLGRITANTDTALIFDEVITGFRIGTGGAQQHFGVEADLTTYGKVIGGGMPIGAIAGKAKYMDALDGGYWQFGDDSQPEVGMTYFAGTFVRHPLAMAASRALLSHVKSQGQSMYDRLNGMTERMAGEINAIFAEQGAPIFFAHFGSLFKVQFLEEVRWGELLFAQLRHRGIHIWDHRPCLLMVAHEDRDVDAIVSAFRDSLTKLQQDGFLPGRPGNAGSAARALEPHAEAKLGKDREGNPAWFVPDMDNPGQFLQVAGPAH